MLGLESVAAVPYRDPWQLPLSERLKALSRGRRRVAYFYELADNSTFRYRVYNMAQVLNEAPDAEPHEVSAGYFFLDDLPLVPDLADRADLLVICRTRYDHRVAQLIASFRARGRRVLYDTDDLVFDPAYAHLLVTTLDLDPRDPRVWNDWFAYTARLGATLGACDGAITTTPALAERLRACADVPVAIVPNFLNREQLALSDRLFEAKSDARLGEDGLVHLGYFSGSPSHNRDFAMVVPALQTLLDEDPGLGVVVVGFIEPGPALERFGSRVRKVEFQDYVNLQRLIARVEYNLMPLQYNVFTHCKSELKYFDAAVVGTVSVASPTASYRAAIRHGDNGWLAQSHQWLAVLRQALAARDGYRDMAERAHADARQRYAWTSQRQTILTALGI
ncbi:MAG: glycosyltransferase [Rubrivivax sp.]|nr:glycosyltransferase [Rubrivivax sp.]